jgi:sugar fermentation stimulation protein A
LPDCYIEVKNVTLYRQPRHAEFPDCVTERGTKHLHELTSMVHNGHRAIMAYVIQGGAALDFALTADLDPKYVEAFRHATAQGVEAMALTCHVSPDRIAIEGMVPILDLK